MHIEVRDATAGDASAVADLFYNTVLNVNLGDYSVALVEEQPETSGRSQETLHYLPHYGAQVLVPMQCP